MKKLLTILLLTIIFPLSTYALNPRLIVGDTELTGSILEISGTTGKATYNPSAKTLTLDNYSYTGIGTQIEGNVVKSAITIKDIENLTILVKGTNTINVIDNVESSSYSSVGIFTNGGLIVKGQNNSTLNINVSTPKKPFTDKTTDYDAAIYFMGPVKVEDVNLNINVNNESEVMAIYPYYNNGEITENEKVTINNSNIDVIFNSKHQAGLLTAVGVYINNSNISAQTNDYTNASFSGISTYQAIINDSKIEMSSTYVKDLRNGFPVSQGINSCFDLRIKNSEIYLDLYQGFNINTTDTTELLDLYINDFNYDSFIGQFLVDKSIIEVKSQISPLIQSYTQYGSTFTEQVPNIIHNNYTNYTVLVGQLLDENIEEWDYSSKFTNNKYLKIYDRESSNIYLNNEIDNNIINLSEKEQKLKDFGFRIEVNTNLEETNSIINSIKEEIENNIDTNSIIATYLESKATKKILDNTNELTQLNEEITLNYTLNDSYINNNPKVTRTYKVYRYYDNNVEEIECTINNKTISFNTDKMSIYAITYQDSNISNPKTGDNIVTYLLIAIVSLVILLVCLIIKRKKK